MDKHDLLQLRETIETSKTKVSELKGSEKQMMKTLKEDWGCSSIAEAEKKIKEMTAEIEETNTQIKEKTEELEDTYLKEGD